MLKPYTIKHWDKDEQHEIASSEHLFSDIKSAEEWCEENSFNKFVFTVDYKNLPEE